MPAGLKAYAQSPALQAVLAALANVVLAAEKQRKLEEIAGKTEVPVDALRQGRLVEGKLVYRQTFVIRSYEVGADKTASVETLMNHFQVEPTSSTLPSLSLAYGFSSSPVVGIGQTGSIRVCTKMICNPFLSNPDQSQINLC
jgi:fatty acyl-ACP thioesterase B